MQCSRNYSIEIGQVCVPVNEDAELTTSSSRATQWPDSYCGVYLVHLPVEAWLFVSMSSSAVDPYLSLMYADLTLIGENDSCNIGGVSTARLWNLLPAGDYRVEATTFNDNEVGAYHIEIQCADCGENYCGFTDRFRLAGYVDGAIAPCVDDGDHGNAWDGTFTLRAIDSCGFCFFSGEGFSTLGGGGMGFGSIVMARDYQTRDGEWVILIVQNSFFNQIIWHGYLPNSRICGPVGTFIRDNGCAVNPTLTVEQYTP